MRLNVAQLLLQRGVKKLRCLTYQIEFPRHSIEWRNTMSKCFNPNCLHRNPPETELCQQCSTKLLLAGRYRALEIIGEGGFGRTFKAVDELKPSKPLCAIEQFLPTAKDTKNLEKARELFEREAIHLETLGKHQEIPEL